MISRDNYLDLPINRAKFPSLNDGEIEIRFASAKPINQSAVHRAIEIHASRQPEAVALTFQDHSLSYGALNESANRLAHFLKDLGVGPEARVCVCVEPSLYIGIALLGIFKAGGVYVPLDPGYPQDRLTAILEDIQPAVVLTQAHLLPLLPATAAHIFCFDRDATTIEHLSNENPGIEIGEEQTAYIVYTSGTTGRPKGVMASYRNLRHYISVAQECYGFDRSTVMPAMARFTFSITFFELLNPLVAGGTLVILERDHVLDFKRMAQTLEKLTVIHASPSLLKKLLAYIEDNDMDPQRFEGLRHVSTGGDMVPPDVLESMKRVFRNAEIYVIYGCSEVSCMACTKFVSRDTRVTKTLVGQPFPDVSVRLYDSSENPVAAGVPGEVYICGEGLTKGYLNQPELTGEKFVLIEGKRFYRTGDRGRFDADGNLEILGRTDFQINLNGIRIEPEEIEAVLRQAAGVREGVAAKRELPSGEPGIVAYIVPDQAAPAEISALRNFLKTQLPDYMVPSAFVILDALPVNLNQKIDRNALPAPDQSNLWAAENYIEPQTELERQIADIWDEVLGIGNVGIHNEFFELGGQSLLAAQVIFRLQDLLQLELSISSLFKYPTVAELASHITKLQNEPRKNYTHSQIIPVSRNGNLPLSFSQKRLWFQNQLDGSSAAYNIPVTIQLDGNLNLNALQRAVETIVQRHEILRTSFRSVDGVPDQVITPEFRTAIDKTDLRAISGTAQMDELQRLLVSEAQRPFDLGQLPLFRTFLFQLSAESHVFLLNFHHIIYDGWSIDCLTNEISALYEAFSLERPNPLPELPIQYADFSQWQQQRLTGETLDNLASYWRRQMDGAPAQLELPTDRPRPPVQNFRGRSHFFSLDPELALNLQTLSQESGVTLFMTLLAAYAAMLSNYSRQEDIVIGCPAANRSRSELESLIGFFVNTLPMRVQMHENPTFLDLLARVRDVSVNAYEHQDLPFEKIVEDLNPERSLSYSPIFQAMFSMQNAPMANLQLPGITVNHVQLERGTSMFDMTLWITETDSGLKGEWEYNSDLFESVTIDRMAAHFETLLKSAVEDPARQLSQLSLLPDAEQKLLAAWNDTKKEYPECKSIHQLFEEQVERTPNAVALIFEDQQLTYLELNIRANKLAHHLRKSAVKPDVLVGICVERSIEMIVGILAVLKAGGAYVPLDPAYPQERIRQMLADSQAPVLLTQDKLVDDLKHYRGKIVRLDGDAKRIAQETDKNPVPWAEPNSLAYVIYTSGSTGKPNGVAIEHRSTVALLQWANTVFTPEQLKGVLASTSMCFDLSVYEMFAPLSFGGTVILVESIMHLPVAPAANEVTLINTVPSAITELLRMKGIPASVRTVNLAGEPLKTSLVKQIYELGTVKKVYDLYGPTEDTTYSTFTLRDTGPATIGRPVSNGYAYLLDRHLQPVPIGVPGELYLGGDGLARCYLNQPELTAERFIKDPFSVVPDARIYKTGDLARYRPTGEIEYLGRIDNQVKIRGFRIELGEIENTLSAHPDLKETVVIAREDLPGDKRLAAYFVPKRAPSPKAGDLRDYLKQTLPDYMVPSTFIELDEMPLTTNGKIDRKMLPAPSTALSEAERGFVSHRDSMEQRLVRIWEKLLNVQPIGIHDNFFELGGHSLQAIRMFAEIEQSFGKNIPLATLFGAGTIEKLACILRHDGWTAPESSLVPIQPNGTKRPFFCIHAKGGNVLFYRDLARHMGTDQPFYGLQARRLGGRQVGHATVEEMAEFYINEIRMLQPEGPYYIGGSSFGGLAALEIAQQLHTQGQQVALLALMDTSAPGYPKLLPETTAFMARIYGYVRRIEHHRDSLMAFSWSERSHYILEKLEKVKLQYRRKLNNTYKKIARKFYQNVKKTGSIPKNYVQIEDQIEQAGLDYAPMPYSDKIILFRATNQPLGIVPDPTLGWKEVAVGGLEIHEVPGHHGSIIAEPYVRVLAEQLGLCIDMAVQKEARADKNEVMLKTGERAFVKLPAV